VLLPIFIFRHKINSTLFGILLILFLTGIFNITIGNNTWALFLKVFTGLSLSYLFYFYVISEFDFNVKQLFVWYLKGSFIVAAIGLIQFLTFQIGFKAGYDYSWLLNKWGIVRGGNFGIRVNSIFGEPTYLAATLSAAFFVSIYNLSSRESFGITKTQSVIIVLVYILSFSGLGQLGIFVSLILLAVSLGFIRYILVAVPAAVIVFGILYNNVEDFRDRYDSTLGLFSEKEEFVLGKTHGSSFILYNNYKVAMKNFQTNFLFGSGIGSHPIAFSKYTTPRLSCPNPTQILL
jgi:hypothetical protein